MNKSFLETASVKVWVQEGILHVKIKENAEFSVEQIKQDRTLTAQIIGETKLPVLIDANEHFYITPDGQRFAASEEGNKNRKAVAYYTDSLASRIVLTNFKLRNKPAVPTEVFKEKAQALKWLKEVSSQN